MRRPSIFTERRGPLDVKMTPMIDVVFLLLVFFVWTASFQIVEQVLPSNLSEATSGEVIDPNTPPPPEADFLDVVVRILWVDGAATWQVNDELIERLDDVERKLNAIYGANSEAPVTIHPDADTPLGDVVQVYDISRRVGFAKVRLAVADRS